MIILRYLVKQVITSMLAITAVLLLIIMSARFIKYLAEAASGGLATEVLFTVMAYRLPGFLEMLLPLGLFLGVLMTYGRLYLDSEMTVLSACGMSNKQLVVYTLIPSIVVAIVVAILSMQLSPWGFRQVEALLDEQKTHTEFDALSPGRFQQLDNTGRVTYAETLSDNKQVMHDVFISQRDQGKNGEKATLVLLVADQGRQYIDKNTGSRFLVLEKGYRYDGSPGEADYRITRYDKYAVKLSTPSVTAGSLDSELKTTRELWQSTDLEDIAQLQWRISLPLLVPIIALIAVPMSRVSPRQGRYLRLLPSIILYMGYLTLLSVSSNAISDGSLSPWLGLWWIHLMFLGVGLALLYDLHHKLPWYRK